MRAVTDRACLETRRLRVLISGANRSVACHRQTALCDKLSTRCRLEMTNWPDLSDVNFGRRAADFPGDGLGEGQLEWVEQ